MTIEIKRRGFLGTMAAFVVGPVVPSIADVPDVEYTIQMGAFEPLIIGRWSSDKVVAKWGDVPISTIPLGAGRSQWTITGCGQCLALTAVVSFTKNDYLYIHSLAAYRRQTDWLRDLND